MKWDKCAIKVNSMQELRKIQEILFKEEYVWLSGNKKIKEYEDATYITAKDGFIGWLAKTDEDYIERHNLKIIGIQDVKEIREKQKVKIVLEKGKKDKIVIKGN
jgi:hypothetical protein